MLPLPVGETLGDANDVNASGTAVGSVNAGISQRGVVYSGGTATVITQTTPGGSFFLTAFGINDSGRVVGQGIDPANAARNVGIVYDIGSGSAFEVASLPGANGALAFGVSNAGHVVGSGMMNQGSGTPFIWSQAGGAVAIPLAAGTSQGSARGVNSAGWVVGTDSGAFAVPFLYDGTATYRLADLISAGTGWDLSTNTSSSALGISDANIIVGTGVFNGQVHAYAMVPLTNVSVSGRVLTSIGAGIRNSAGHAIRRHASRTQTDEHRKFRLFQLFRIAAGRYLYRDRRNQALRADATVAKRNTAIGCDQLRLRGTAVLTGADHRSLKI